MVMLNHGCGDPYDDDEQFYRETASFSNANSGVCTPITSNP